MWDKVDNYELFWSVFPPLLLLAYYYRRVLAKPPLSQLLLCFGFGALLGILALGLEFVFENLASRWGNWDRITRSLAGVALRQLVAIGPIEEGCKLGGVMLFQFLQQDQRFPQLPSIRGDRLWQSASEMMLFRLFSSWRREARSHSTTIFMWTIAIALGFTAEENLVYLANGMATVSDRAIGTPIHAMFSAPWGYALASRSRLIAGAWVNAVVCHALVNVLSISPRYSPPLSFLSYGLFPFLVWMFWRLEKLLRRVQHQPPIILISGLTPIHCYWQMGLVLFALFLGGNALFGFFLLARTLSPISPSQLLYPDVFWFIVTRSLLNLIPGLLAWGIYRYLRHAASSR